MSPEEQRARGGRMQELINDPLMREAFEAVVDSYYEEWLESAPSEVEKRERLHASASAVHEIKMHMVRVVSQGKLADAELEIKERERQQQAETV